MPPAWIEGSECGEVEERCPISGILVDRDLKGRTTSSPVLEGEHAILMILLCSSPLMVSLNCQLIVT